MAAELTEAKDVRDVMTKAVKLEERERVDGAAITRAWPGAELVTTTGLGHHRIVSDPGVIRQVVAFLGSSTR